MGIIKNVFKVAYENRAAYLLILPAMLAIGALLYFPMIKGTIMAFHSYGVGEWVGISNFAKVFSDELFHYSLIITLIFIVSTIVLQLIIGLLIALIVDKVTKFSGLASAIGVLPYMVPPVAGGILWFWMFSPSFGLINQAIQGIGLKRMYFLSQGYWPIFSIIIAQSWKDYGYASIIYLATLKQIPGYLYDSADVDGAGPLQKFRFITLPHLRTATLIILAIRTVWNIIEFAQPFELTAGGPGTRTTILSILLYKLGFVRFDLGSAYVVGLTQVFIALFAFLIYAKILVKEEGII